MYSVAAVLILPFVSVYTRGVSDANYLVSIFPYLMCAVIGIRCLQLPYNVVVQAAGHFKETQNSAILEPVINILISLLLVREYNLTGVAIGMLCSVTYRLLYLSIYLTRNILQSSKKKLLKRLVFDGVLAVSIVVPCSIFNLTELTYQSWLLMAIEVTAAAAFITLMLNLLFYNNETIRFIRSFKIKK